MNKKHFAYFAFVQAKEIVLSGLYIPTELSKHIKVKRVRGKGLMITSK